MKASIQALIASNPSGLMEMKSPISMTEYADKYGFNLQNTWKIYESKLTHHSGKDWFDHGKQSLPELFQVQAESDGDLLVVFIVETIESNRLVHCNLILTDEAFREILADKSKRVLKVHQMYSQYDGKDYIALNMDSMAMTG